ncbi:MAG: redoxin domain-containing protein [Chitinophagales bacterium]|nr:redoxin domain-containing protein [Chitinophagales bacterium]MBP9189067.1 redoxin domain-containing protein [Chitinophagales bacterium]MBP9797352.1 redoxin domain-containing protein [Chitinophagales bacterium]
MANNNKIFLSFLIVTLMWGCNKTTDESLSNIELSTLDKTVFKFEYVYKHAVSVITFFSPECPLSENYTKNLNDLQKKYEGMDVLFVGIVPGNFYSEQKIDSFKTLYNVQGFLLLDRDKKLTNYLKATITPETFVLDSTGTVRYSGAIDNWAVDLGQKREVITEFYLMDAIEALLSDREVAVTHAPAVGCFIE